MIEPGKYTKRTEETNTHQEAQLGTAHFSQRETPSLPVPQGAKLHEAQG